MATTASMKAEYGRTAAFVFGIVFLIIGLLAYFANPVVWSGGLFLTNRPHDWVHILSGIAFIVAGYTSGLASVRAFQVFWVIYGIVAVVGLIMGSGMMFGFLEINGWDNVLHVVLSVIALYLGFRAYGSD